MPILDSVQDDQRHGMQVVSGIILGLDTDTLETGQRLIDFIDQSQIPMLTINLLQALRSTPLWDRLEKDDRLDRRRRPRIERALPLALRRCRAHVAPLHEGSL